MRENRIRKREDFLNCYERGAKFHSAHFIIYALVLPQTPKRYGITVSRKTGNAVIRNRVKRVLREFFRLNFSALPEIQIVVVAKKNAAKINLWIVEDELLPLLRRLAQKTNA